MSTAQSITYDTDAIATLVHTLADRLNREHRTLSDDLTGSFKALFDDVCKQHRSASDSESQPAAVIGPRQTMSRLSFQRIMSALKQYPQSTDSSIIIDGAYHLRHFSARPNLRHSLFHNGKAVIAHDTLIPVLLAIWEHASVSQRVFKDVVAATCAYVPVHVVSRFFLLVKQISPAPTVPIAVAPKSVIGRSNFGHTVLGESYLRIMTPNLTPGSASAGKDTSSLMLASPPISSIPSTSGTTVLPSPDAPASAVSIASSTPTRKRTVSLQEEGSKRMKIDDGDSRSMSPLKKRRDKQSPRSGSGAAGGRASKQPVAKLPRYRRSRSRTCLLWPWNLFL